MDPHHEEVAGGNLRLGFCVNESVVQVEAYSCLTFSGELPVDLQERGVRTQMYSAH